MSNDSLTPATVMRGGASLVRTNLVFSIILALLYIAIQIWILVYLFHLEKIGCKCARDYRRTYSIVFIIFSLCVTVTMAILSVVVSPSNMKAVYIVNQVLQTLMVVGGIVYIVFVLQYIARLNRIKCACSGALVRDVWEILVYIYAALMAFGFIMALVIMGIALSTTNMVITGDSNANANANADVIEYMKAMNPTGAVSPVRRRQ